MYSQFYEETFILKAVEKCEGSTFLDVGAFHPTDKSNTRALYEAGWSGVMIEPSPVPMRNLLAAYGNDKRIELIEAAVTLEPGLVKLHVTDDAITTSSEAEFETWKEAGGYIGSMHVPGITLEQIANQFGGNDFISLDAEGTSVDLFLKAIIIGWEPKCWCVEHNSRQVEVMRSAETRGYHCVHLNSTNMVLLRTW